MKKYAYKGFYGDYGSLTEHNNGAVTLYSYINGKMIFKGKYKNIASAKSALYRRSDSFTLTEVK